MTSAEFKVKYGQNWTHFTSTAMYQGLLSVLETEHPLKSVSRRPDGDRLQGATVLLNLIVGWDQAVDKIKDLAVPIEKIVETESTYTEDQIPIT